MPDLMSNAPEFAGGMPFRDPPFDATVHESKVAIARALVNARTLPVDLPAAGLRLIDIKMDAKGFDLVFAVDHTIGRIRLERLPDDDATRVTLHDVRDRERMLQILAERLRVAVTRERYDSARVLAKELLKLPIDVPLTAFRQILPGIEPVTGIVRLGFRCNQDCGICWQDRTWGRFDDDQVRTWIEDFAKAGVRALILSGGEPMLDPALVDHVRYARSLGFDTLVLETNAIQAARGDLAVRLRAAGVTDATVSLHSGDAAVSDAITRAPGTHGRTVKGTRALLEAGITVQLNAVLTAEGLDALPSLPDFVHEAFGPHPHLRGIVFSSPCDPFDMALIPSIAPDPARLRRALRPAIKRALDLGIRLFNIDGPCGFPLCAIGLDPRVCEPGRVAEEVHFRCFLPVCDECSVKQSCFGVRRNEADMHGDRCVEPLRGDAKNWDDAPVPKSRARLPVVA